MSFPSLLKSEAADFAIMQEETKISTDFSWERSRIFLEVKEGSLKNGEFSKGREDQSVIVGKEWGLWECSVREQDNSHGAGSPPKVWMEELHFLMLFCGSRE